MKTEEKEKKINRVIDIFRENGLALARIFGSKTSYWKKHKDGHVFFNANAIIKSLGKVWYGDIHIERDEGALKDIAAKLREPVFILREMDARFGAEEQPVEKLIKLAVWNTEI